MEIEVIYGLCNRLQTIIGFYTFNSKLKILWKENEECPGNFTEYFKDIKGIEFILKSEKKLKKFYKFNPEDFKVDKKVFKKIFIKNHTLIKPIDSIQEKIEKANLKDYIGIHIRRTDFLPHVKKFHPDLVKQIDDKYFYKIIRNILKQNPSQKIFLATDNKKTQITFYNLFPRNIKFFQIINDSNKRRQTALENTIIDIFSLISCKEFYGTKRSSLTDFVENYRKNIKNNKLI